MNNFYNLHKMIAKHIPQNKYQKYSLEKLYQKKRTYDFFFTNKKINLTRYAIPHTKQLHCKTAP